MDIKEADSLFIANTYSRFDLEVCGGTGSVVYDKRDREYIDLGAGIGVNTFGVSDPIWVEAVKHQISQLAHFSNLFYTVPQIHLAQMLCERTGMKKVFFCNSGTEANEAAIKCARKYSRDKYGQGRHTIITLKNSFHGRTFASLSATGQEKLREDFLPALPGFHHVEANDINGMRRAMDSGGICAIMLETIQGEGGVLPLCREFLTETQNLAADRDILVIIDEVQTGNGRTGHLYSYMKYGLKPDIVTTAKGLGAGLPIGASIFGEKTSETLGSGTHGSTFGGNPVCAAGAISVISRLTDDFLAQVREKGEFVKKELEGTPGIIGISGQGLMLGIETAMPARELAEQCLNKGVIVLTAKDRLRLLPPLNIETGLLKKALTLIKEVIAP